MEKSKIEEIVKASLGDRQLSEEMLKSVVDLFVSRYAGSTITEEELKKNIEYCLPIIDNNVVADPLANFAETGEFENTTEATDSQGNMKAQEPAPSTEEKKEEEKPLADTNTATNTTANTTAVSEENGTEQVQEVKESVQNAETAVQNAVQQVQQAQSVTNNGTVSSDIQAQLDALKAENERIATELAKKTAEDLREKRTEEYKAVIEPLQEVQSQYNMLLDNFNRLVFEGDEDFNKFIDTTKVQVNDILQDLANKGLQMTAPGVGVGGDNNFLAEQIKANTNKMLKNGK